MDIQKAAQEIAAIEREKAQLELLVQQLEEMKKALAQKMLEHGVTPENIDEKIAVLEKEIEAKLAAARGVQAPAAGRDVMDFLKI
jgi:ParB-like chromosome segregation protein Spo0J